MKDTPERDAHFPQWAVRLLPGFQDSVRKLNGIPAGAVSSGLTCIHPDIQGLHALHPNGQGWKTNQGDMGTRGGGGQCTARWEPHRQAIWRDEEAPFPIPPLRPSMSSCIPFTLHRALLQNLGSRATRQLLHPFARSLFLPVLTASPGSVYPFTSSHGELKQGWLLSGRKYMGV